MYWKILLSILLYIEIVAIKPEETIIQKDGHISTKENLKLSTTGSSICRPMEWNEENINASYTCTYTSMEFVKISAGTFFMGSTKNELCHESDETQHNETISKDFYLGIYEVTQAQWRKVMGNNPSHFNYCDNCPVEQVSWLDVQDFITKLNKQTGRNYRLPTEAEWEYSCRAGTATPFNTGNNLTTGQANYDGCLPYNSDVNMNGTDRNATTIVGSFSPNKWGLYDMHGNVYEWCSNWYDDYQLGHMSNPKGFASGTTRVIRGGNFACAARYCRSAYRDHFLPNEKNVGIGFRLVLEPNPDLVLIPYSNSKLGHLILHQSPDNFLKYLEIWESVK